MSAKKVMVITGASRGIGAEIALSAASKGYITVINYNNSQKNAEELCQRIKNFGGECIAVKADISNSNDVNVLYEK